ncbi:hypothetical protein ACE15N_14205 [Xanthomonas campestris pv. passiflorae]|nr:hypothetical protein [Xanthomonas campestris]MBV6814801.1 hypothetical protein [Xanthomonas campestris pv. passiflorae]
MLAQARLHRRAQRLLPAGIETVALLPAALPGSWESSALSALPLNRDRRRGVVGLQLHARTAQQLRIGGHAFLQAAAQQHPRAGNPRTRSYGPWQRLGNGSYWARSTDALLGVLLATDEAAVWLLWQQPQTRVWNHGHWLR